MFRNYLGPAFARIAKAPFTSAANILTLALGLACFIAAFGITTYWQSADNYQPQAGRTYLVTQLNTPAGKAALPMNVTSTPALAPHLKQDFPDIQHIARAMPAADIAVAAGKNKVTLNQGTVDPDFLKIFHFDFVAGEAHTALAPPDAVILTQEAAQRLFGQASALGQRILVNGKQELTVTGVIRAVRQPSFMGTGAEAVFRFDMLRNWAGNPTGVALDKEEPWLAIIPYTFVVLPTSLSPEQFDARLPVFLDRHIPDRFKGIAKTTMRAMQVSKLTTYLLDKRLFASSGMKTTTAAALLALAALTLVIACINYANLATAQATGRSKEIGMRRVLGAGALSVMTQAWLEAVLLTALAAGIALAVLALLAPVASASMEIDLLYFLAAGPRAAAVLPGLIAIVAFFAGAYPALILSRVRPAAALRSGKSRSGSPFAVRALVAIQFASAGFLLILVTVTQLQRQHLEETVLAPRQDPVAVLNDLSRIGADYDTLANRLAGQPGIQSVTVADIPPWSPQFNGIILSRLADPGAATSIALAKTVGAGYFDAFNLKLLAGRVFDPARDTSAVGLLSRNRPSVPLIIIDLKLLNALGFVSPQAAIGKQAFIPASATGAGAAPAEIIGVIESEPTALESLADAGVAYSHADKSAFGGQLPIVRLKHGEVSAGVESITRVFNEVAPNIPPQIRFYDEQFEQAYRQYGRLAEVFILLASTAFIIASVGLLGIAVHVAARRRHEIAVRKTLGSSAARVVRLLLADFSQPVLVGNLIAWPLAWLAAETYLRAFSNRIELSPAPFIISLAITLAIAWGATIGVVLRAATQRPADVLRRA